MTDDTVDRPDQEPDPTPASPPSPHVTPLRSIERQVGEHVLNALDEDEAVAVLTTIAAGVRNDRVVSVPLNRGQVNAIRDILEQAQEEARQADDEDEADGRREGFLGFHTVLREVEPGEDDA